MGKLFKYMKNEKGLTLVELLAVLVILGIIGSIAVPTVGNIISDSRDKAIIADAQMMVSGAQIALAAGEGVKDDPEEGDYTFDNEVLEKYVEGIELGDNDKVVYDSEGKSWTVYYSKLSDVEGYEVDGENGITKDEINEILSGDSDGEEGETTP